MVRPVVAVSSVSTPARLDSIRYLLSRARDYVANAVKPSSQKTYSTGVNRWFEFVEIFGTDPLMRRVPAEYLLYQSEDSSNEYSSWQEACVMGFLAWLQCPPHQIQPKSAFGYLYAVKHFLVSHGVDLNAFVSSVMIAKEKKGMLNDFLADEANLEANTRTLPLSLDILMSERPSPLSRNPLQDLAFFVALLLGFTMLSRVSNYLPNPSASYHLDTEHISFTIIPLPGDPRSSLEVPADQLGDIPLSRVVGASAFLKFSKTDGSGKGKRIPFVRRVVSPPDCVYDIVTELYQYVRAVRPVRGKPFFYVPGLWWSLTPTIYNARLRDVALKHGLDPDRVHSHSIRIGGATVLAAAGVPDYIIMAMGGWASAVYLQYIRPSFQLFASAQAVLTNATFMNADSIRSMHPDQVAPSFDRLSYVRKTLNVFLPLRDTTCD